MFGLRRIIANQSLLHRVSAAPVRTMRIVAIPNQIDNYSYLLIDRTNKAAAIDIFDVSKVEDAAQREGVQIVANITTHHHKDHSGGNKVGAFDAY
jgi:hydroxyacylglutathione hydrolase